MILKECSGYELVKEKPNTSEDYFNRSKVTFVEGGKEHTVYVLYLRYFEENLDGPYATNPLFTVEDREICLKDIVALLCLLHNRENKRRKRIYISSQVEFAEYFENVDYNEVEKIFQTLQRERSYHLGSDNGIGGE